jgi:hypothetical protein
MLNSAIQPKDHVELTRSVYNDSEFNIYFNLGVHIQ